MQCKVTSLSKMIFFHNNMKPLLCVTAPAGWKLHLRWEVCVLHPTNCRRASVAQPFAGGQGCHNHFLQAFGGSSVLKTVLYLEFPIKENCCVFAM